MKRLLSILVCAAMFGGCIPEAPEVLVETVEFHGQTFEQEAFVKGVMLFLGKRFPAGPIEDEEWLE